MTKRESLLRRYMRRKFEELIAATIRRGSLTIETPDGQRYAAGDGTGARVCVRLATWAAVSKLVLHPDLALGEAYMDGDLVLEEGDIYMLLEVLFVNLGTDEAPGLSRLTRTLVRAVAQLGSYNSPEKSRDNVAHHYDLDGRLYDLFLDSDSQYSCGYFEGPASTLEEAQMAKKRHLAAKLDLREGQHVLDIGSGWGGLALYMARMADVSVRGVTLSEEQLRISRQRAREGALEDKVRFDLQDYRSLEDRFDRIVSVGMFEHVGRKSYAEFFSMIGALLADDGVALLHYIGRTTPPSETNAWILKYIFPGGYMPALSEVLPEIERHGLVLTDVEVLRLHYAETLKCWRDRFVANRSAAIELYDERFARMWEFYLAAAETGFRYQGLVIHQLQFVKSQEVLPLTRGYIERQEETLRSKDSGARQDESDLTVAV